MLSPSAPPGSPEPTGLQGQLPFGQWTLPALILGVPVLLVAMLVALQIAGGAAWLPIVRRWLGTRPVTRFSYRRRG
jgi:hypothetical protein